MSEYQVLLEGTPVDKEFYEQLGRLEVEENADLPGAVSLSLPVAVADGELTWVGDARIGPYANIAVVATAPGGPRPVRLRRLRAQPQGAPAVGRLRRDRRGVGAGRDRADGADGPVKVWSGMSEADVAAQILSRSTASPPTPPTARDPGPTHTEDEHALMQRASDAEFLRRLARRTGRWFRVVAADKPGVRTGYFAAPSLDRPPVATIGVTDPATSASRCSTSRGTPLDRRRWRRVR